MPAELCLGRRAGERKEKQASSSSSSSFFDCFCFSSHVSGISETSNAGLRGSFVKSGLESDVALVSA
jgi:hypothetical protein